VTQDFLKCIHHFASQHYGSAGQLFDSAAQYRKEKKEKRRLRMLETEASGSKDSGNTQEVDSDEEGEDDESVAEGSSNSKSKNKDKGKGKVKHRGPRKKVTERDMYKAFEGSALLCIGTPPLLPYRLIAYPRVGRDAASIAHIIISSRYKKQCTRSVGGRSDG
jgi:hypothetical protein